jgi:hypothetical protein
MLLDVPDVVAVDLRDVDQAELAIFELEERSVRGDALYGALYDRTDL